MATINESPKSIEVIAESDILVVGSGPAGLAAAVSAAREGMSVILVERYGCFGGVISQVGVESIAWYRHEGTTDVEGIGIEFEQRAKALGGTQKEPQSLSEALDAEMFKFMADQLIQEAQVTPLLHCLVVAPILEGNTIKGVITESKMGRKALLAKIVIDASGDADIAYRSGVPFIKNAFWNMCDPILPSTQTGPIIGISKPLARKTIFSALILKSLSNGLVKMASSQKISKASEEPGAASPMPEKPPA